ncbi:MAG: septal ring lytic transglycosylase RlpA family protein [Bacteroidota bacterium]|jgi:rare lipoprotein A
MKMITATLLITSCFTTHPSYCQISNYAVKNDNIEEGTARYYATHLHGKFTSFGEKYDDAQLTASHSKYPLNTLLKVTNLENNLSTQVRINDYCKCEEDKIVNLSKEAASKLAMMATGKARVRLELVVQLASSKIVDKTPNSFLAKERVISTNNEVKGDGKITVITHLAESPSPFSMNKTYNIYGIEKFPKGFGVQVAALSSLNTIQDLYDELVKMGIKKEEIYVQVGIKDAMKIHRIMFGQFYTKEVAQEIVVWLSQHGYKGIVRSHYNL